MMKFFRKFCCVTPSADDIDEEILLNDADKEEIPNDCLCPISKEIYTHPVIAADGFTYDESSIKQWFAEHDKRYSNASRKPYPISPMTGSRQFMRHRNLMTNHDKIFRIKQLGYEEQMEEAKERKLNEQLVIKIQSAQTHQLPIIFIHAAEKRKNHFDDLNDEENFKSILSEKNNAKACLNLFKECSEKDFIHLFSFINIKNLDKLISLITINFRFPGLYCNLNGLDYNSEINDEITGEKFKKTKIDMQYQEFLKTFIKVPPPIMINLLKTYSSAKKELKRIGIDNLDFKIFYHMSFDEAEGFADLIEKSIAVGKCSDSLLNIYLFFTLSTIVCNLISVRL